MVDLRIDRRLRPRLDPSDVLQEAYQEAAGRLDEFLRDTPMPLFLWVRKITRQKLIDLHHHHLNARKRSARREVPPRLPGSPEVTSVAILDRIEGRMSSPSQAAMRSETRRRLLAVLEGMSQADREILALRYFEGLTGREAATVLGIAEPTARKRYLRALKRLREILDSAGLAAEERNE